jgi:hypothetical protein
MTRTLVVACLAVLVLNAGPSARIAAAQDLEARLRAVEDRMAIEQLLMRYAAAFNTGDADAYVSTFTPDGSLELRRHMSQPPFLGPFTGREALRKQWFPENGKPRQAGFGCLHAHVCADAARPSAGQLRDP